MAVSTVSYTNTPQAGDDIYGYQEDYFHQYGSIFLDVMSNDLGGKAKTLYSIEDSDNVLKDLLSSDVAKSTISEWEGTADGNRIRINCGKIEFQLTKDVDSLTEGQQYSDSFVYAIRLGNGTLSYATVTVNITGQNDAAAISGNTVGSVSEDDVSTTSGELVITDVDTGEAHAVAYTQTVDGEGTFSVDADGKWVFKLDNAAVQHMGGGDSLNRSFTVTSADGTATKEVVVTIHGTNDKADMDGDYEGGVAEDGAQAAAGKLNVSDVDDGEAQAQAFTTTIDEGTFNVDQDGNWTFDLDNAAVQHLGGDDSVTRSFTVTSADGTASEDVVITINGNNDAAGITGNASGSVTEDGTAAASGKLTVTDDDAGEAHFAALAPESLVGTYGDFTFDSSGNWTYTLRNNQANVQALNTGDHKHDMLTIESADGSTQQTIDVTVNGTDEPVVRVKAPTVYDGAGDTNDFDTATGTAGSKANGDSVIVGDADNNNLTGADGNDGADLIYGREGNDVLRGGDKADALYGNAGNDSVYGDVQSDKIYGGSGNDELYGGNQNDELYGGSGTDKLYGEGHNDILVGGFGADSLTGGTGAGDTFRFIDTRDTGDTIYDFEVSLDRLDFSFIDANTAVGDNQAFSVAGDSMALAAYSINWFVENGNTIVQFDNNGDTTTAEFEIALAGSLSLSADHFLL